MAIDLGRPHRVMTREEYDRFGCESPHIVHWNYDGFGNVAWWPMLAIGAELSSLRKGLTDDPMANRRSPDAAHLLLLHRHCEREAGLYVGRRLRPTLARRTPVVAFPRCSDIRP